MKRFLSLLMLMLSLLPLRAGTEDSIRSRSFTDGFKSYNPYTNWYAIEPLEAPSGCQLLYQSIAPLALTAGGLCIFFNDSWKQSIQQTISLPRRVELYDDELRYLPLLPCAVFPFCGLPLRDKPLHAIPLAFAAYGLSDLVVYRTKQAVKERRPRADLPENDYSFPSQHTAMAFVAATVLHRELGQYSPWISVGGYAVATYVGFARIGNNFHWSCDVLCGAAAGILCTELVYWTYDAVSHWISSSRTARKAQAEGLGLELYPALFGNGAVGAGLSLNF